MQIKEDTFYVESGCAGEILALSDMYDDTDKKPIFLGICVAFFSYSHVGYDNSINNKIRHIWNIIKKGHPYQDELIFDIDSAKNLRNKLDELINKAESVTK